MDADIVAPLCHILRCDEWKSKREACWALSNATLHRDAQQIKSLLIYIFWQREKSTDALD